jgi:hypothetical protein
MKSATVVALCLLLHLPARAQINTLTLAAGKSVVGNISPLMPTQVFHAGIDGADGRAGPTGYAEFFYEPGYPITGRSELSISTKAPKQNGRIYAETGPATVGVAFDNPNNQDVTLSFFFTDSTGTDFGSGSTIIPANGQIARFLTEAPFNAPSGFRGTLTYSATAPLAALAIRGFVNDESRFLMPQIPVADSAARPAAMVPYFQDGASSNVPPIENVKVTTELILVNPTDSTLSGGFTFYGQVDSASPGQPVNVNIDGEVRSAFSYSIPPRSSRQFATAGGNVFQRGSIQIQPAVAAQAPFGFAIVTFRTDTIVIRQPFPPGCMVSCTDVRELVPLVAVSQTTIPGQASGTAFRVLVRGFRSPGPFALCCGTSTAVAIANPSETAAAVSLDLPSMNASATLTVPPRGQILATPQDYMGLTNGYSGTLRVSSSTPVAVVGLQNFSRDVFGVLALEMFDESVPVIGEPIFPHLAEGGGYHVSLFLIKTSDSQASTGLIRFYTQSGAPLDPTSLGFQ